ncbi:DHA2 family efflux MFS transporter permease subunit [Agromyces binzhouensis]|uniref:DHA2 family efflux MFS transporter permease subunit n=1 Tax=Agromyces binzhouensis TaxID=1817495 RepID=A0A4V1QSV1_9MICO|nr:DHA2 family efflux MFS transporter permease subunit [Agromyces binzhouensis]RXZ49673.1 DHA2 family efflux MFS transporter permease subunit [Agromyces binzhouensis]
MNQITRPWPALWALVIGFFMILVDTTIVSIANPAIMADLEADLTAVIWVTSAYLLAYAVPLLITGRLGDRFGPKRVYLVGLVVFTLASLWCGLSGDITMLIAARAAQGLGAAMMTPQTMAVITRVFPPNQRGAAMGLWGSVAGVATLLGPILGGVLVDTLGWEWVFFVNVPVGIIAFIAAWRLVPSLATQTHRFDWLGVVLSAVGLFLIVFGIQEGETYDWGTIVGPITVWAVIAAGVVVLAAFIVWQAVNRAEPLLPLSLFRDRNFALSNVAISLVGLAMTAMPLPLAFYFQVARGLTPTQAALMLVPMAVVSGVLAPLVGRLSDRVDPKWVAFAGLTVAALALGCYVVVIGPDVPFWLLLLPSALLGLGISGVFAPLASTATRNLPRSSAGAGSGVYTLTRQVGSVLGSAAIAALMSVSIATQLPGFDAEGAHPGVGALPDAFAAGFSTAMAQSLVLAAGAFALCAVVVLCFAKPKVTVGWGESDPSRRGDVSGERAAVPGDGALSTSGGDG